MISFLNLLLATRRTLLHHRQGLVFAILFAPLNDCHAARTQVVDGQGEDVSGELGGGIVMEGVRVGVLGGTAFRFS